jgi:hypothetical protein
MAAARLALLALSFSLLISNILSQKLSGKLCFEFLFLFSLVVPSSPDLAAGLPFPFSRTSYGTYIFFCYSNLPSFTIASGDFLAFDLYSANDYTPAFASIAMATSTEVYTTIVGDSAANSKGDSIAGNFELQFKITAPFSFAGGTLIIRFQNGGSAAASTGFSSDTTISNGYPVLGKPTDASG